MKKDSKNSDYLVQVVEWYDSADLGNNKLPESTEDTVHFIGKYASSLGVSFNPIKSITTFPTGGM